MRNLLANAIKFTPVDGRVSVRIFVENLVLRIEVQDNGVGISAENQSKLFHNIVQFNTNAHAGGGSGLGLWISKRIIDMHSGSIGASSDGEGKGALFFFELPVVEGRMSSGYGSADHCAAPQAAVPSEEPPVSPQVKRKSILAMPASEGRDPEQYRHVAMPQDLRELSLKKLHVFVVDDSALNRKMLMKRFEKEGYSIAEADDGDTAVAYVQEKLSKKEPLDVITMDNVSRALQRLNS